MIYVSIATTAHHSNHCLVAMTTQMAGSLVPGPGNSLGLDRQILKQQSFYAFDVHVRFNSNHSFVTMAKQMARSTVTVTHLKQGTDKQNYIEHSKTEVTLCFKILL